MFDFPSPAPDTILAFFEKVKEAKQARLKELEQELKTLNADKQLSQNKYVQEGLEKVERTGISFML